ncbi:head GIN domain-containing protein [Flavivirga amylovorans]|uniref:Head GIN domain-containing protein n=1 Tax=Flavivirga amylovorans TaxID=870486 RepID=A0ABT8X5S3_9FLAO|nr:head GIN domain-containing protein [Flavivirga amylovorans]MDO5989249.1 head GIN domain-containing protein [Flavivirga amylovorans]
MKRLIVILTILVSTIVVAQKPIEKSIGEFTHLKVYDLIDLELIKSDNDRIVITGKNNKDVLVNNKNGTLKIKMKLEEAFDGNKTKVQLYYTALDVIDVNEGAKVTSKETIEQFEIDLNAQEGGKIIVNLDVKYANIRSVTGATIETTGSAKHQDISIYTGGIYDGEDLKTEFTDVSIRIAGKAYVRAKTLVNAKIRAGGDIFIYGKPERVDESRALGGRIKRMD